MGSGSCDVRRGRKVNKCPGKAEKAERLVLRFSTIHTLPSIHEARLRLAASDNYYVNNDESAKEGKRERSISSAHCTETTIGSHACSPTSNSRRYLARARQREQGVAKREDRKLERREEERKDFGAWKLEVGSRKSAGVRLWGCLRVGSIGRCLEVHLRSSEDRTNVGRKKPWGDEPALVDVEFPTGKPLSGRTVAHRPVRGKSVPLERPNVPVRAVLPRSLKVTSTSELPENSGFLWQRRLGEHGRASGGPTFLLESEVNKSEYRGNEKRFTSHQASRLSTSYTRTPSDLCCNFSRIRSLWLHYSRPLTASQSVPQSTTNPTAAKSKGLKLARTEMATPRGQRDSGYTLLAPSRHREKRVVRAPPTSRDTTRYEARKSGQGERSSYPRAHLCRRRESKLVRAGPDSSPDLRADPLDANGSVEPAETMTPELTDRSQGIQGSEQRAPKQH
ncbi:hypothetical protein MBM_00869 [Drepanopeziza brunnea f. sp. 'multigermtubi' MB_m1]|uniref:Uncharacterized protein n=1 Tax=Marssonina brunnea f. sp. multigermtubi (strain MB_m1) TaxID=1072389 RepID=K1X9J6_MARBU|nr:uncharacterized protein MBM_00869 [Drepanopeziza brunnea f. sp. 'multigermtubi' MB_m1]EKD21756.1 hypothetical protein MBM_00869 [Drepanopeziza brunnea f. sp. 'multigermtubi' MB_m1]